MQDLEFLDRNEVLTLPVCTRSYIILRDHILNHADAEIFRKFIKEYLPQIPVFELMEILSFERILLGEELQNVIELLFAQE